MGEFAPTGETKKEVWLGKLAEFLLESYQHGWAAGAEKQKDLISGEKTLQYERDGWKYVDRYRGYFAAPGESNVFYKGRQVWSMNYAGEGQNPEHYDKVQETYAFLQRALSHAPQDFPVRGSESYTEDNNGKIYWLDYEGSLEQASWDELILLDHQQVFSQKGTCGIVIDKDANYQPVYPWDL